MQNNHRPPDAVVTDLLDYLDLRRCEQCRQLAAHCRSALTQHARPDVDVDRSLRRLHRLSLRCRAHIEADRAKPVTRVGGPR